VEDSATQKRHRKILVYFSDVTVIALFNSVTKDSHSSHTKNCTNTRNCTTNCAMATTRKKILWQNAAYDQQLLSCR